MKTYTFQIADNAQDLKVLFANVAKSSDLRWYLHGLLVDPDGVLVATDGHAMAELDYPSTDESRTAIKAYCAVKRSPAHPNLIIPAFKVAVRGGPFALQIEIGEDTARVFAIDQSGKTPSILLDTSVSEGRYPEWRRVSAWKDHWKPAEIGEEGNFTLGVNPHLLSRFQPSKDSLIRVTFSGPNAAMRVQALDSQIRGTVMPARV
jgi:hypothetical protein